MMMMTIVIIITYIEIVKSCSKNFTKIERKSYMLK